MYPFRIGHPAHIPVSRHSGIILLSNHCPQYNVLPCDQILCFQKNRFRMKKMILNNFNSLIWLNVFILFSIFLFLLIPVLVRPFLLSYHTSWITNWFNFYCTFWFFGAHTKARHGTDTAQLGVRRYTTNRGFNPIK